MISGTRVTSNRQAAIKAWATIRAKQLAKIASTNQSLTNFLTEDKKILYGRYKINPPLIKPSKLTRREEGGVGKELSDGWAINFAIGCLFGCRFCYVDSIHKLYSGPRVGEIVQADWGYYFAIPSNLDEAIESTPWNKWKGKEVLLSSTHDPYLPQLCKWTKKILEKALSNGVNICIQTRSPLVLNDLNLIKQYREQVRLQISISTIDTRLARIIEPRVVDPYRRLEILSEAKKHGVKTGVIIAPILPRCKFRPSVEDDLREMFKLLSDVRPDYVYGESLHVRGSNMMYLSEALGDKLEIEPEFDRYVGRLFKSLLNYHRLKGVYWYGT